MTIVPLTVAHIEGPMWDSTEAYERLHGRLRWHLHTPYAHALCVVRQEEVAGIATAIRSTNSARITLCHARNEEVRTALADALLAQLDAEHISTVLVTAAPLDLPFWSARGFEAESDLLRYTGGRFLHATQEEVVHLEPQHRMAVLHLDKRASGEDRGELLMEHAYLGSVYLEGNVVRGFALPLLGDGLIIADSTSVGLELQRWLFPTQEHLVLPEGNAAHGHLNERGYRTQLVGTRMVRGTALPYRPQLIYAEPFGVV